MGENMTNNRTAARHARKPIIILVEDDTIALHYMRLALQRKLPTYRTVSLTSAKQFYDYVASVRDADIAALVTDGILGVERSGLELLAYCREKLPYVIRLLVSAFGPDEAINSLAHRYFIKPIKPSYLAEKLKSLLAPKAGRTKTALRRRRSVSMNQRRTSKRTDRGSTSHEHTNTRKLGNPRPSNDPDEAESRRACDEKSTK
jgi:DNA-binding NtrC family response regulator